MILQQTEEDMVSKLNDDLLVSILGKVQRPTGSANQPKKKQSMESTRVPPFGFWARCASAWHLYQARMRLSPRSSWGVFGSTD
jgi:hypothetical protein